MRTTAHHRPARRAHEDDDAALDYAYDAGQRAYQNEVLQERLHEAQRRLAPPPRGKRLLNWFFTILVFGGSLFVFFWIGLVSAPPAPAAIDPPLGTAEVVPTRRPADPPRQDSPVTSQDGSTGAQAPEEQPTAPPPTSDYGVASYNATQQAIAVEQVAPEATPLPEPGEPTFVESFQPAQCSAMITYLRGHPCYGRVNQAPQPQPGDDDFAASFK